MRHLKLFESFIQALDEISYSDHWKERTSYPNEDKSDMSRILPYSNNFRSGFKIEKFIDGKKNEYTVEDAMNLLELTTEQMDNYVTKAIRNLARSKKLERWESESRSEYLMLGLGRICFYKDKNTKLYPLIKGGDSKNSGFYDAGDMVWGLVKKQDEGITVKYYPNTEDGITLMAMASEYDARNKDNISAVQFSNSSKIEYPYGKNFNVIVDLTDDDPRSVESKMKSQVEGYEWTYGPRARAVEVKRDVYYLSPDFKRITVAKGLIFSRMNKETGKEIFYEVAGEVLNASEIYEQYKKDRELDGNDFRNIPVEFQADEVDKRVTYDRMTNQPYTKYIKKSSFPRKVTLTTGDLIYIKKTKSIAGGIIDPDTLYEYRFITSEPKILEKGSVQIALDIVKK